MQRRFRFSSIAGLMALVGFVALAFASLRSGSALWASATFTMTLGLLGASVLGAYSCRDAARMAWMGFGVFGWSYLAFTFGPVPNRNGVTPPPFPTVIAYEALRDARIKHAPTDETGWSIDGEPRGESLEALMLESDPSAFADAHPKRELIGPEGGIVVRFGAVPPFYSPSVLPSKPVPLKDFVQLRRIVHALGAIAFGLVGAAVGWGFAAWNGRPARRVGDGVASPTHE